MFEIGNQIKYSIQDVDGIVDLNVEQQIERPQLKITPKRDLLAKYGISLNEFSDIISVMLAGEVISQVYESNRTYDLTDRKSTRLNSSHVRISYAVFCLKKKKKKKKI